MSELVTFISNAGGSIVSKNILSHKGKLRWCVREEAINDVDNGWRFFADIDTEEYLSKADNMCICDFNTVAKYSLQGTTQSRYLTGGVPPVRFSM